METKERWIITLQQNASPKEIKKQITSYGFNIEQVLEEIGCITGTSTTLVAKKIKTISGVADISLESGSINIGPPGSPLTW